jgi:uncharacterized membrane protein YgdD (TMEM256/DUF423 family)
MIAVVGAVAGLLAVALGAFGAHALEGRLTSDLLAVYETAARYHLVHALAMLAAAWARASGGGRAATASGWGFGLGMLVFSGSLYLMGITGQRWLGAITPVGGLLLMGGWGALAVASRRATRGPRSDRKPRA